MRMGKSGGNVESVPGLEGGGGRGAGLEGNGERPEGSRDACR